MPLPLLVAGGAVLGAAVSGGINWWAQRRSGQPVDWSKVGRAAAVGAAFGGLGAWGGGVLGAAVVAPPVTQSAVVATTLAPAALSVPHIASAPAGRWIEGQARPAAQQLGAEGELVERERPIGRWTDPVSGKSYETTRGYVERGRLVPAPPRGWPSFHEVPDPDEAARALQGLADAMGGGTPTATDVTRPIGGTAARPIRSAVTRPIDGVPTDLDRATEALNDLADQIEAQTAARRGAAAREPSRGMIDLLPE